MRVIKCGLFLILAVFVGAVNAGEAKFAWAGSEARDDCHAFISDTLKKRKNNVAWCVMSEKTCKGMYGDLKALCKEKNLKKNAKQCSEEWTEEYLGAVCDVMETKKITPRAEQVKQLEAHKENLEKRYDEFQELK